VRPSAAVGRAGGAVGVEEGAVGVALVLGVEVDGGGEVLGWPAFGLVLVQAVTRKVARQARARRVAGLLRIVTGVTSP